MARIVVVEFVKSTIQGDVGSKLHLGVTFAATIITSHVGPIQWTSETVPVRRFD